jgi:hypothetical protein
MSQERPGANDLSDDAIQQIMDAESNAPMRTIIGDNMPESPRVVLEREQANDICELLDDVALDFLRLHEKVDRIRMMVKRYAME